MAKIAGYIVIRSNFGRYICIGEQYGNTVIKDEFTRSALVHKSGAETLIADMHRINAGCEYLPQARMDEVFVVCEVSIDIQEPV